MKFFFHGLLALFALAATLLLTGCASAAKKNDANHAQEISPAQADENEVRKPRQVVACHGRHHHHRFRR